MEPITFGLALLLLLAGHFICDYPLQGEFLAVGKNRHTTLGNQEDGTLWIHALTGHAVIHGGMVALITGNALLGVAEAAIHWITDWAKCERKINLHVDQLIHVVCKTAWALIAFGW